MNSNVSHSALCQMFSKSKLEPELYQLVESVELYRALELVSTIACIQNNLLEKVEKYALFSFAPPSWMIRQLATPLILILVKTF